MIKVADYIADYLAYIGVKYIHILMGGGAATLNDSLCKHPNLEYICYHSESIASYAAFGEAKYTNKLAVLNTTSGIGTVNALSGILSSYCDSVPLLVISGNTALKNTCRYIRLNQGVKLRQMGVQDNDIIEMSAPITKYSVTVKRPEDIAYELEKCIYECCHNRPGPCLIEIPSDVANSLIEPRKLEHFVINETTCQNFGNDTFLEERIGKIKQDLQTYQRPLILAGGGIRQSNTVEPFREFIEKYQIPFIHTFLGVDLAAYDNPLCLGNLGVKGKRNANFSLQNCNYLLILGTALTTSQIGYLPDKFAFRAKKVAVDIDYNVLEKTGFVELDEKINCDLKDFFKYVNQ